MLWIEKIVAAQEIGRVTEQARTHGVALAGDGVGASSGAPNVSSHQGEIDDGLGDAGSFVTLIDAHGPPEGNAFAGPDRFGKLPKLGWGATGCARNRIDGKLLRVGGELGEAGRMARDEFGI